MLTSTFDGAPEKPATVNVTFLGVTDEHGVSDVPSGIAPSVPPLAAKVARGAAMIAGAGADPAMAAVSLRVEAYKNAVVMTNAVTQNTALDLDRFELLQCII
jgi:hypothetical protein